MTTIQEGIRYLASVCDGAEADDGVGFSACETSIGHQLAAVPDTAWTDDMLRTGHKFCRNHFAQLYNQGLDDLPEPPELPKPPHRTVPVGQWRETKIRSIWMYGGEFVVKFSFNPSLIGIFKKTFAQKRFGSDEKCWYLPTSPSASIPLERFADKYQFGVTDEARATIERLRDVPVPVSVRSVILDHVNDDDTTYMRLIFDYDPVVVDAVRALPDRKYNTTTKVWSIRYTPENALAVFKFAQEHGFDLPDGFEAAIHDAIEARHAAVEESQATDAELHIEGLGGELRPFQRAGVAYALKMKRTFIADEMGLGKTIEALAIAQAADAFPLIVVCPASVKYNWKRETEKWLPNRTVSVIESRGQKAWAGNVINANVTIINYDILKKHLLTLHTIGARMVIFDESHYAKNHKAKRTEACEALAENMEYRLCLTGTPVMNRPKELLAQLTILGRLEDMGGFWKFVNRYCGCYRDRFGLNLDGATNLDELAEQLRSICFIRRTKEQVLPELPPKQRTVIDMPIDNKPEYREAEANLLTWVGDRAAQEIEFLDEIKYLEPDEHKRAVAAHRDSAEERAARAEELVRVEALKQIAAKGKLAESKKWIENFLESDEKLVVFATHINIQTSLLVEFPDAARILGSDKAIVRQENVDRFQTDPDCRLIVCSLQAGGVGITLTAASNVAFLEQGWTPAAMDQAEDRLHRIGQQDSVNAWYLLDMNTIDGQIWNLIEDKRSVTDQVTQSVLSTLLERIKGAAHDTR